MTDVSANNKFIDEGPAYIIVPKRDDLINRHPEEYLNALDKLESPRQRISLFLRSIVDPREETHESQWIRTMAAFGGVTGALYGGIVSTSHFQQDYIRKHNAAVFEGRHTAHRHYVDSLIYKAATKAIRPAIVAALLSGSAGVVSFGSINYRNRLYFPDWIIGFAALGGLTRTWLGPRAMAVGGFLGSLAGLFGYGLAFSLEAITGESVTKWRYLHHLEYLEKREEQLKLERLRHEARLKKRIENL